MQLFEVLSTSARKASFGEKKSCLAKFINVRCSFRALSDTVFISPTFAKADLTLVDLAPCANNDAVLTLSSWIWLRALYNVSDNHKNLFQTAVELWKNFCVSKALLDTLWKDVWDHSSDVALPRDAQTDNYLGARECNFHIRVLINKSICRIPERDYRYAWLILFAFSFTFLDPRTLNISVLLLQLF